MRKFIYNSQQTGGTEGEAVAGKLTSAHPCRYTLEYKLNQRF